MRRWYRSSSYVPRTERKEREDAVRAAAHAAGREPEPVQIDGRTIVCTFWGKAWCRGLESHSDYHSRLSRGRTYARRGSILDLQITEGHIHASVTGSMLYDVHISVDTLKPDTFASLRQACAGQIDSVLELIEGRFSHSVMEVVTQPENGLLPMPREIHCSCSCPDWAVMCKHVAAALYGVGARLDRAPGLLFILRGLDARELLRGAIAHGIVAATENSTAPRLALDGGLASLFGLDPEAVFDVAEPDDGEEIDEAEDACITELVVDSLAEADATVRTLARRLGIGAPAIRAELEELKEFGMVGVTGTGARARWWLD